LTSPLRTPIGPPLPIALEITCLLACLTGCHPQPPKRWEIALTDYHGRVKILRASPSKLFLSPWSAEIVHRPGTLSRCSGVCVDPSSGTMATIEDEKARSAIRVYDSSMRLIGEHVVPRSGVNWHGSPPIISPEGKRLAFFDEEGIAYLADIDTMQFRRISQLPRKGAYPSSTLVWAGKSDLAIDYLGGVYRVDLQSSDAGRLGVGELLGVQGKDLLISMPIDDSLARFTGGVTVATMALDGRSTPLRGKSIKVSWLEFPYPGGLHRASPDGEYVAYSTQFWCPDFPLLAIQHLRSGRKVYIKRPAGIRSIGSWNEFPESTPSTQTARKPEPLPTTTSRSPQH
jgi:hypothetical protein